MAGGNSYWVLADARRGESPPSRRGARTGCMIAARDPAPQFRSRHAHGAASGEAPKASACERRAGVHRERRVAEREGARPVILIAAALANSAPCATAPQAGMPREHGSCAASNLTVAARPEVAATTAERGSDVLLRSDRDGPSGRCSASLLQPEAYGLVPCMQQLLPIGASTSAGSLEWRGTPPMSFPGLSSFTGSMPVGFEMAQSSSVRDIKWQALFREVDNWQQPLRLELKKDGSEIWREIEPQELTDEESKQCCDLIRKAIMLDRDDYSHCGGRGAVFAVAEHHKGCWVMQAALEVWGLGKGGPKNGEDKFVLDVITSRLEEAWSSPHANHVLQACIRMMPGSMMVSLIDKLLEQVPEKDVACKCKLESSPSRICPCSYRCVRAARHRYGCRVLERILEHCGEGKDASYRRLVAILTDEPVCVSFMKHNFGNFVVQHLLEHGGQPVRSKIVAFIERNMTDLSRHRIASHVVEKAMFFSDHPDKERLVRLIINSRNELKDTRFGSFVYRRAWDAQKTNQRPVASLASSNTFVDTATASASGMAAEHMSDEVRSTQDEEGLRRGVQHLVLTAAHSIDLEPATAPSTNAEDDLTIDIALSLP